MEAVNNHAIPVKRCINRAGWIGNEFYPYEMRDIVQYHDDDTGATNLVEELHTHGSEEKWLDMAAQVRTYPFARFMLAVCFASPLLNKVSHRNIYTHIWFESRGGKTAVAKLGLGIWGDPEKLMGTYNATIFGLEQHFEASSSGSGRASVAEGEIHDRQRCCVYSWKWNRENPWENRQRHP